MPVGRIALIAVFGIVGWALCGSIVFVGREITSIDNALIVHAVGAPIIFGILSWIYFSGFSYTSPPWTAVIFTGLVIGLDVVVVALLIERNLEMFGSILGTWLPWVLIFASTYLTGRYLQTRRGVLRRT
jgi:hypothetical protein